MNKQNIYFTASAIHPGSLKDMMYRAMWCSTYCYSLKLIQVPHTNEISLGAKLTLSTFMKTQPSEICDHLTTELRRPSSCYCLNP